MLVLLYKSAGLFEQSFSQGQNNHIIRNKPKLDVGFGKQGVLRCSTCSSKLYHRIFHHLQGCITHWWRERMEWTSGCWCVHCMHIFYSFVCVTSVLLAVMPVKKTGLTGQMGHYWVVWQIYFFFATLLCWEPVLLYSSFSLQNETCLHHAIIDSNYSLQVHFKWSVMTSICHFWSFTKCTK